MIVRDSDIVKLLSRFMYPPEVMVTVTGIITSGDKTLTLGLYEIITESSLMFYSELVDRNENSGDEVYKIEGSINGIKDYEHEQNFMDCPFYYETESLYPFDDFLMHYIRDMCSTDCEEMVSEVTHVIYSLIVNLLGTFLYPTRSLGDQSTFNTVMFMCTYSPSYGVMTLHSPQYT